MFCGFKVWFALSFGSQTGGGVFGGVPCVKQGGPFLLGVSFLFGGTLFPLLGAGVGTFTNFPLSSYFKPFSPHTHGHWFFLVGPVLNPTLFFHGSFDPVGLPCSNMCWWEFVVIVSCPGEFYPPLVFCTTVPRFKVGVFPLFLKLGF